MASRSASSSKLLLCFAAVILILVGIASHWYKESHAQMSRIENALSAATSELQTFRARHAEQASHAHTVSSQIGELSKQHEAHVRISKDVTSKLGALLETSATSGEVAQTATLAQVPPPSLRDSSRADVQISEPDVPEIHNFTDKHMGHVVIQPTLLNAFKRYKKLHAKAMSNMSGKFVVYHPGGQLCNILRGTLAAFLFALLTDRVLLVHPGTWYRSFYDVFERPGFDIEFSAKSHSWVQRNGENLDMDSHWERLLCSDLEHTFKHSTVTISGGAKYFNSFLYRNPHYQDVLQSWFTDGDIARPLTRLLFRPVPEVFKLKEQFIANKFPRDVYRIGMHIRTEHPPTQAEWDAFKSCATAVTPPSKRETSKWFVATDREISRKEATKQFSNVKTPLFIGEHFFNAGNNLNAQREAVADILVAAEGDKVMLSPSSSYSGFVALFAKTEQLLMVTDWANEGDQDPHKKFTTIQPNCHRFRSRQPCAWHGPKKGFSDVIRSASCYTPDMQLDYC